MLALGLYILTGLVVCVAVALLRDKFARSDGFMLSVLFDPLSPLLLLWPLWLALVLVEHIFLVVPSALRLEAAPAPPPTETAPAAPIGQIGVVVSALRPLGRIQIVNTHFDARSDGRIVVAGTRVRVLCRAMNELVVAAEPTEASAPTPPR